MKTVQNCHDVIYGQPLDHFIATNHYLNRSIVFEDGELDGFQLGVKSDRKLGFAPAVGYPDQMPFSTPGITVVPESCYEAELLGDALIENPAKHDRKKCMKSRDQILIRRSFERVLVNFFRIKCRRKKGTFESTFIRLN